MVMNEISSRDRVQRKERKWKNPHILCSRDAVFHDTDSYPSTADTKNWGRSERARPRETIGQVTLSIVPRSPSEPYDKQQGSHFHPSHAGQRVYK